MFGATCVVLSRLAAMSNVAPPSRTRMWGKALGKTPMLTNMLSLSWNRSQPETWNCSFGKGTSDIISKHFQTINIWFPCQFQGCRSYLPNSKPVYKHSWKLFWRDSCWSLPIAQSGSKKTCTNAGIGWNCGISLQARPAFAFSFAGGSELLGIFTPWVKWHQVTIGNS